MRHAWLLAPGVLLLTACDLLAGHRVSVTARDRSDYPVERFSPPTAPVRPLHVISIYEASSDHGPGRHPGGDATVEIDAQDGPFWLALAAYEPVRWRLSGPGVAQLQGVYLAGYGRHTIAGAGAATVVNRSGAAGRARRSSWAEDDNRPRGDLTLPFTVAADEPFGCAYTYARASGGGCEAGIVLAAQAAVRFRAGLASFTGVYNGAGFRLRGS